MSSFWGNFKFWGDKTLCMDVCLDIGMDMFIDMFIVTGTCNTPLESSPRDNHSEHWRIHTHEVDMPPAMSVKVGV